MSKEQSEGVEGRPYSFLKYIKSHIEKIKEITDSEEVHHELDMILDDLYGIEYQFGIRVTKKYHKEKMLSKNIEIETLKNNLRESIQERVELITELEIAENNLREFAGENNLRDDLYVYKWKKYMEGLS